VQLSLNETDTTATTYTIDAINGPAPSRAFGASGLNKVSQLRYFKISKSAGSAFTAGTFRVWYDHDGTQDGANLKVAMDDATNANWTNLSGTNAYTPTSQVIVGNVSSSSAFTTLLSTGNYFSLANANGGGNALDEMAISCAVSNGWNMISVPVKLEDYIKVNLFPTAQSNAFLFNNGYLPKDTLKNGAGYWLKFAANQNIPFTGVPRSFDSVDVSIGWNMIGGISYRIPTSHVTGSSGVIISSPFYKYQSGYSTADSIAPGKGYWVKTSAAGKLYMSNTVLLKDNVSLEEKLNQLNTLTVTDKEGNKQTLYFGSASDEKFDSTFFELPPLAPEGIFDIRFSSNNCVEFLPDKIDNTLNYLINVRANKYPLVVTWHIGSNAQHEFVLRGGDKEQTLTREGSMTLSKSVTALMLDVTGKETVPAVFKLNQNYPNPFNPSTQIKFSVDKTAKTTLDIYNILGQKVATLFNDIAESGKYYTVKFDGSNFASGVYFYKLQTSKNTDIKKLMLLK
jgi:hypothetical protein